MGVMDGGCDVNLEGGTVVTRRPDYHSAASPRNPTPATLGVSVLGLEFLKETRPLGWKTRNL